jgi:hypothetical protein
MAGFGDATSSNDSKEVKLKPKQQWDRYTALKKEKSVVVGVKVISSTTTTTASTETESDWLVVGAVKSESTIPADVAVARQRALLVEVCIRYFFNFFMSFVTCLVSHFALEFPSPQRQNEQSMRSVYIHYRYLPRHKLNGDMY